MAMVVVWLGWFDSIVSDDLPRTRKGPARVPSLAFRMGRSWWVLSGKPDEHRNDCGTDQHRHPEVGDEGTAEGDDCDPGKSLDVGDGVHRGGRIFQVT
ncbi:MAG: hypothetical protein RLZZ245_3121 [Verrucomicrobiota bacterium]